MMQTFLPLKFTAILSIIFLSSNVDMISYEAEREVNINVSKQGVSINSIQITKLPSFNDLERLIGRPDRSNNLTESKIKEVKERFGVSPNRIYTYDQLGVLLYQPLEDENIKSIRFSFIKGEFDFSPSEPYSNELVINGHPIDKNTSLAELKTIKDLFILPSSIKAYQAHIGGTQLTFEFISKENTDTLVGISIDFGTQKVKEWTEEKKAIFKSSIQNLEPIKNLSIQFNFNMEEFASCYTEKISNTFSWEEIQAPSLETQKRAAKLIEECIGDSIN